MRRSSKFSPTPGSSATPQSQKSVCFDSKKLSGSRKKGNFLHNHPAKIIQAQEIHPKMALIALIPKPDSFGLLWGRGFPYFSPLTGRKIRLLKSHPPIWTNKRNTPCKGKQTNKNIVVAIAGLYSEKSSLHLKILYVAWSFFGGIRLQIPPISKKKRETSSSSTRTREKSLSTCFSSSLLRNGISGGEIAHLTNHFPHLFLGKHPSTWPPHPCKKPASFKALQCHDFAASARLLHHFMLMKIRKNLEREAAPQYFKRMFQLWCREFFMEWEFSMLVKLWFSALWQAGNGCHRLYTSDATVSSRGKFPCSGFHG